MTAGGREFQVAGAGLRTTCNFDSNVFRSVEVPSRPM